MLFTDYISVSSWLLSSQDENIFYDFSGLFESNQCKLQPQIYRKVWKGKASAALWFSVCQWRSIHNITKGILIFNWHHLILLPVPIYYCNSQLKPKCLNSPHELTCIRQSAGKPVHTVSFDWFLSGLEWILNLEFCLLKLLTFYQKLSWNIRSRINSSTFWVFESVFTYVWSKSSFFVQNASILIKHS